MIHLLNLSSLECVDLSRLNAGIRCLTYTNGGNLVVGLDNGDVLSISADGNHSLHAKISRKAITALEYINNRLIVASEDRQLRSLDLVTFQVTQVSDKQSWAANGLAFDKETQHLLAAGSDNKLHLIDANSLKSSQVLDESSAKKNLASSNHGFIAVADCHGEVSVLNSSNYTRQAVLPVSDEALAGMQIPDAVSSLFIADRKGFVQEWDLANLRPITALKSEGTSNAFVVCPTGSVIANCGDKSVQVFIKASHLDQFVEQQKVLSFRNSFLGRIATAFRSLFRLPIPDLPSAPSIPLGLAQAALHVDPEVIEIEQSLSAGLVEAYQTVSKTLREVNWKEINESIDQHQRHKRETELLRIRRMREERLAQTLQEAQQKREYRQQQETIRQQAAQRALAEKRSKEFWDGVGSFVRSATTGAIRSSVGGTWVGPYTRKDGTRVKGYRRK